MHAALRWLRHRLPLVALLLAVLWIIIVVVWIALSPAVNKGAA